MVIMSTGVVSILLHELPYGAHWLRIIADVFFALNITLFLLFTGLSILRYCLFPELILKVVNHPHQGLFVATFPVGLATIVNMIVLVCVPAWGHGWGIFAWVLWWIVGVMALATCFHLTYIM
jgi:tellurite resistance protein TehA-like permease